ncbi:MAG TPA: alpha/beta fold hydrolase [Ilumatobacteraceae bacterium]|nr:alpha/beta fold hydrolase [Ilumatobacteraceae bacterium]
MTTSPVLPGAEPLSHVGTTNVGVLVLHGFTGNPISMRGLADAMVAAGHHVEMPLLPGHGTVIEDMLDTTWADWTAEVAAAHGRLAERANSIIVMGLSMGGALTLWAGMHLDAVAGLVCVNPATVPAPAETIAMLAEMVADGTEIAPAISGDIADPDGAENGYDGTPLRPLLSFMNDGLAPMTDRYGELTMPLLLITSRQDHVVEPANSEHLAATHGGEVEHVWLERSYHVATVDFDAADINRRAADFVARVTSA